MRTLYLECCSGISGDMTAAALLDLGGDRDGLLAMLESMPLHGFHVEIGQAEKCGIAACDFEVVLDEQPHEHRHLADIYKIIENTDTSVHVKNLAKRMFEIVAEAEAKAHKVPVEKVHFHEVGAVDSIVDIMSVAYLIESLEIDRAVVSELYEGRGQVRCQHGILPVPVPAVVNIIQEQGLTLRLTEAEGEMITPTGAAVAAALREYGGRAAEGRPRGRLLCTGTGAGKKDFLHANVLRAMLFEEETDTRQMPGEDSCGRQEVFQASAEDDSGDLWMLETNIDDCTGEMLGYVLEILLEAGACDVFFTPIYMKKNRPAYMLSVMCDGTRREHMENLIFRHTTTIGIRRYPVARSVLERQAAMAETSYGVVRIKRIVRPDGVCSMPEYESIREICAGTGEGFPKIYEAVRNEAEQILKRKEAERE
ncbi:nickel pincer cofactor biosynthesis protein LarC [Lachnospiraceae bacterium 46-15]